MVGVCIGVLELGDTLLARVGRRWGYVHVIIWASRNGRTMSAR
jgi:hypothetical protein